MNVRFDIDLSATRQLNTRASIDYYQRYLHDELKKAGMDQKDELNLHIRQYDAYGPTLVNIGLEDQQSGKVHSTTFTLSNIGHDIQTGLLPTIVKYLAALQTVLLTERQYPKY